MGMTPETISRWETGAEPIGPTADRLLRLMVATRDPVSEYPLEMLTTITKESPAQAVRLGVKRDKEGWHAAAA
jgi:hypothetical protein